MFVAMVVRLFNRSGSSPNSLVKRVISVLDKERDVVNAVTVLLDVLRAGMVGRHWGRQDEIDVPLA